MTTLCHAFAHSPDAVIGIDKADVDQFNEKPFARASRMVTSVRVP
jgi:hypothetical protein